jgi:hypothetical protein
MLDRQKIETILMRRFPGATHATVAAATNAIMGLDDEWQEENVDFSHLAREFNRAPSSASSVAGNTDVITRI